MDVDVYFTRPLESYKFQFKKYITYYDDFLENNCYKGIIEIVKIQLIRKLNKLD